MQLRSFKKLEKNREEQIILVYTYTTGPSQGLKIRDGHVILGGDNVLPLVEIGLTDLPKTARAPPKFCAAN